MFAPMGYGLLEGSYDQPGAPDDWGHCPPMAVYNCHTDYTAARVGSLAPTIGATAHRWWSMTATRTTQQQPFAGRAGGGGAGSLPLGHVRPDLAGCLHGRVHSR